MVTQKEIIMETINALELLSGEKLVIHKGSNGTP